MEVNDLLLTFIVSFINSFLSSPGIIAAILFYIYKVPVFTKVFLDWSEVWADPDIAGHMIFIIWFMSSLFNIFFVIWLMLWST